MGPNTYTQGIWKTRVIQTLPPITPRKSELSSPGVASERYFCSHLGHVTKKDGTVRVVFLKTLVVKGVDFEQGNVEVGEIYLYIYRYRCVYQRFCMS